MKPIKNPEPAPARKCTILKDGGEAYVKDAAGNKVKLIARTTDKGTKYVKTVADDVKSDNLLKLDECS